MPSPSSGGLSFSLPYRLAPIVNLSSTVSTSFLRFFWILSCSVLTPAQGACRGKGLEVPFGLRRRTAYTCGHGHHRSGEVCTYTTVDRLKVVRILMPPNPHARTSPSALGARAGIPGGGGVAVRVVIGLFAVRARFGVSVQPDNNQVGTLVGGLRRGWWVRGRCSGRCAAAFEAVRSVRVRPRRRPRPAGRPEPSPTPSEPQSPETTPPIPSAKTVETPRPQAAHSRSDSGTAPQPRHYPSSYYVAVHVFRAS